MPRMLEISTKAGLNAFTVQRFTGREEMGRMFEYHVELLSERADIDAEQMLGSNATVALELMDGQSQRFFNGYVTRFSAHGVTSTPAFKSGTGYRYLLTLSPALWFMTRSAKSRIFEGQKIADLAKAQISALGMMLVESSVTDSEQRQYIVQYRETDFNFVTRLMEHAGIYYYFTHINGKHTMVLLNDLSKHETSADAPALSFAGPTPKDGTLGGFVMVSEVQPGAFGGSDYNYVTPNTLIAAVESHPKSHDNAGFEMFDHPLETTTASWAKTYAKIRNEELACGHAVAHGSGTERSLEVGSKFNVVDHSLAALNRDYVVVGHSFDATNNLAASGGGDGSSFSMEFEAIPADVQYRTLRTVAKPLISGTQTALVVGDFRNDADTSGGGGDPVGANMARVKVQFYWDRFGDQSCWARVSTPWAGKGYGWQNMPRVGEEVLVAFIEGDPDRPVVVGRVYNAENMPPFKLPANASITGIKTMSLDSSGANVPGKWNELRFDDKDGAEQVYLQAQNDFDRRVLNDSKTWTGNESHTYVKKDAFEKFDADHHIQSTGDHNAKIGGSLSHDVTSDVHLKAGNNVLTQAGSQIHLKGGQTVIIEAGMQLSLKVGGNFIDINSSGIAIKGTMVMVNTGGAAGSGAGASPIAAKDGKLAMTSDGGAKVDPPKKPTPPTAFSPLASSFQTAALTGAAFVAAACPG